MVAAIFLSRVLGLVRDMVVAHYFGAGAGIWADCYKAAFTLPDFLYYLIAGGALSTAFIPVFTEYLTNARQAEAVGDLGQARDQETEAWRVFSIFGTALALGLTGVVVVGELFTPQLLHAFIVPGFNAEKLRLTTSLTRIILPAQLCFFLGGLMMSTLYARNQFLMPALGPVVYNVAIIAGGILGGTFFSPEVGIYGLCWGVLVGAIVGNIFMQLWAMRRFGVQYRPSLELRHPGVVKVAKLMLPVILGLSLTQLHAMITRPFGSFLPQGSIAWLDNANKVMQIPLGIFAQALSVAIFPTLAALAAERDLPALKRQFSLGLRAILLLTVPASALIIVLAVPTIRVLFQRGRWTWTDTEATASATVFYSLAIFAYAGAQIVNRGFYALQNTLTPMLVGTVVTALYVGLCFLLLGPMQHNGLALAMSIAAIVNLLALLWLYSRTINGIRGGEIMSSLGRVVLASLAAGLAAWSTQWGLARFAGLANGPELTTAAALLEILLCGTVGLAVYAVLVWGLRVPEAAFVWETVGRRLRRGRGKPTAGAE
jgi:putative peptidoglycan lipid II flippase